MTGTGEKTETKPRIDLAKIIAELKERGELDSVQEADAPAAVPADTSGDVSPSASEALRRVKRAPNGTQRFRSVMIKLSPEMIGDLDTLAEQQRRSRSALIREAVDQLCLRSKGSKTKARC